MEDAALSRTEVARELRGHPREFQFFQAVRLIERLLSDRTPVGGFADPKAETVRFGVNPSIAFPPSEIETLEMEEDAPARMSVNFLGLTGPSGVLPYEYTELVAERVRARDTTLRDFLDIFHHRVISLFYRAWRKYRFVVALEAGEGADALTSHLLDLIGLGLGGYRNRLPVPDASLAFYTGLLALQPRSATALEQLIEDFFHVPAQVEEFVGGWYRLPQGDWCDVGEESGPQTQLGLGAVVGDEIWDPQARVRIRLGPLSREDFDRFLPNGGAHQPLRALTRFFSHEQFDFELQLVLAKDDVPGFVLGGDDGLVGQLGWSTWIRTRPVRHDAEETLLRL
jgi:type VI secretion system protein ImpH